MIRHVKFRIVALRSRMTMNCSGRGLPGGMGTLVRLSAAIMADLQCCPRYARSMRQGIESSTEVRPPVPLIPTGRGGPAAIRKAREPGLWRDRQGATGPSPAEQMSHSCPGARSSLGKGGETTLHSTRTSRRAQRPAHNGPALMLQTHAHRHTYTHTHTP